MTFPKVILQCADITSSVCEYAMPPMEGCWSYTMRVDQTDLYHYSAYRTVKQSAFVRLCGSTHMNGISTLHGYDYIQWRIGSNTFVILIVFLFTLP
jgi:hypothetical protein